jgi:hypothetical protein
LVALVSIGCRRGESRERLRKSEKDGANPQRRAQTTSPFLLHHPRPNALTSTHFSSALTHHHLAALMNHHDIGMGQYLTSDDPDGSPEEQSTQEATQEAHPTGNGRSQDQDDALKSRRSWGFLQPCSRAMSRADFEKIHPTYSIGRGSDCHIRLRGNKVSEWLSHLPMSVSWMMTRL